MDQKSGIEPDQSTLDLLRKVSFRTNSMVPVEAELLRLTPQTVVFQFYTLEIDLRLSELLTEFKILAEGRPVYCGSGVVRSLVDLGAVTVGEVDLVTPFSEFRSGASESMRQDAAAGFEAFMGRWQSCCRILPEYKIAIADMANFLHEYQMWLNRVELGLTDLPPEKRVAAEREIAAALRTPTATSVGALFETYEAIAARLPGDSADFHRTYCRRLIQPLVLASPFALRAVKKPLGYAGDYELVGMILRDPFEGHCLFGKILNQWFIDQPPAEAHRNRIKYLTRKLIGETARVVASHRDASVFNIGCGPAQEIQQLFRETELSNHVNFTLLDFNDETIRVAKAVLEEARTRNGRRAKMEFVKKSAAQLLRMKEGKAASTRADYDFVYCAGLFDYLPDAMCRQLTEVFYRMLRPGGLMVVTNVDASNPIRHWLGDILEWHLIYRDHSELFDLRPGSSSPEWSRVEADETGVNIFLEVRKPGP